VRCLWGGGEGPSNRFETKFGQNKGSTCHGIGLAFLSILHFAVSEASVLLIFSSAHGHQPMLRQYPRYHPQTYLHKASINASHLLLPQPLWPALEVAQSAQEW